MTETLKLIGMLAGGLGLFLIAVGMITDGLKLAAGDKLRKLLGLWTRSPAHGIATGFTITAIVQSSSAVTIATIGFVNAGLLSLYQALGIVFGSNIGTTMTGWLVAVVGFELNIDAFALPIIGVGMLLHLTGGNSGRGAIGMALAGFGLFFIGIDVLKNAFEGVVVTFDLQRYALDGFWGLLLYIGIGFLMTTLTQSSSAAIAITLTAASGGVVGIYAAAALVIGANVGTTSTAVFSVLGATSNAKRVAAAHVLFNVITAIVALALMPVIFQIISWVTALANLEQVPAVSLALFHTTFNVLGVALMWPFCGRLSTFLEKRFTSQNEIMGRPQYLDNNVLVSPALAMNAAALELQHLAGLVINNCQGSLQVHKREHSPLAKNHEAIAQLALSIGEFILKLQRSSLTEDVASGLPRVLSAAQYFLSAAEIALEIKLEYADIGTLNESELTSRLNNFRHEAQSYFACTDIQGENFSLLECENKLTLLVSHYDVLKDLLLETGGPSNMPVGTLSLLLEHISDIKRMVTQFEKGMKNLVELTRKVDTAKPESGSAEPVSV